jgi:hypothetical protein
VSCSFRHRSTAKAGSSTQSFPWSPFCIETVDGCRWPWAPPRHRRHECTTMATQEPHRAGDRGLIGLPHSAWDRVTSIAPRCRCRTGRTLPHAALVEVLAAVHVDGLAGHGG